MPKTLNEWVRSNLHGTWMAAPGKGAEAACGLFAETHGVNCERAVEKLTRDRDEFQRFYDFLCEHRKHIRTTNPVESIRSLRGLSSETGSSRFKPPPDRARHQLSIISRAPYRELLYPH